MVVVDAIVGAEEEEVDKVRPGWTQALRGIAWLGVGLSGIASLAIACLAPP